MALTSVNAEQLIRSEVWSADLKAILEEELFVQQWVRWITDFPDGNQFTVPSVGAASVQDVVENEDIKFESLDTGEFNFSINEYIGSAHYITDKAKQDAFYVAQLLSEFIPKQRQAIMEHVETKILNLHTSQTSGNLNNINGAAHRFVGGGTNEVIQVEDFAKAKFALKKANVPMTNLTAIVGPATAYTLDTLTNITNVSNNPNWEGIIETGLSTGMRFVKNIYGFDVYESNMISTGNAETIDSVTTTTAEANLFFSADSGVVPFMGAWRQMPEVEFDRNVSKKRDEYSTTARYDVALFREENLVTVLCDDDQV
jgi:hypothetical protein